MPLPVIPNVYRVTLNWIYGGQHAANVMNFHDSTAGTKDEDDLFAALNSHANSVLWSGVSASASVNNIDIIKLDGTSPMKNYTSLTAANWDGGISGSAVPAVAGLVSLRTAIRGPRGRGRVYLPFWAETEMIDGTWQSGTNRAACQAAWATFTGDMATDDFPLQVASYAHGTTEIVTALHVPSALATQRRRQQRLQ